LTPTQTGCELFVAQQKDIMARHLVRRIPAVTLLCLGLVGTAYARPTGVAGGTCLMALERSPVVNKARHAPGSSADFTEIVSTNAKKGAIEVRWRTKVFYGSKIKLVLNGTCFVSVDGRKVKSIQYK
jgi:hypothetical protein